MPKKQKKGLGVRLRKHHEWGARFGRREAPGEQPPREGPALQPNPAWQEGQDLEVGILPPLSLEPRVELSVQNESGREFPGGQTLNNEGTPVWCRHDRYGDGRPF